MKFKDTRAAIWPHVAARLRALDPQSDLGNGTLLADAAATVAAHVIAKRGASTAKNPEMSAQILSDQDLQQIIGDVRDLMVETRTQARRPLPGGLVLEDGWRTGVRIGNHQYVPIRGLPGLHEVASMRDLTQPGQPGETRLREEIAFHFLRIPEMDVPKPTAEAIRVQTDQRYRDRLLIPMRGGPKTLYDEEEMIEPAETLLDIEIDLIARTAAAKAADLWSRRREVDSAYSKVSKEVTPLIDAERAKGVPVRLAGVRVVETGKGTTWGHITITPVIEVLGNDLTPTMWQPFVPKGSTLTAVLKTQMTVQRRRKRIMDEASASGMRGRIERVTLAAVRAYAKDPAEALRKMARTRRLTIPTAGPGERKDPIRLTWRDGKVIASFPFTKDITWAHGTLIVKTTQFPAAVLDSLPGRPISALIEHPFLQAGDTIRSIRDRDREGGWIHFHVDSSWSSFDAETGEVLD